MRSAWDESLWLGAPTGIPRIRTRWFPSRMVYALPHDPTHPKPLSGIQDARHYFCVSKASSSSNRDQSHDADYDASPIYPFRNSEYVDVRRKAAPQAHHFALSKSFAAYFEPLNGHLSSSLPHTPLALGRGSSVPTRGCRLFYGIINTPKNEHPTTRPSSIFLSLDGDSRSGEFVCVAISWARVRRVSEERLAN